MEKRRNRRGALPRRCATPRSLKKGKLVCWGLVCWILVYTHPSSDQILAVTARVGFWAAFFLRKKAQATTSLLLSRSFLLSTPARVLVVVCAAGCGGSLLDAPYMGLVLGARPSLDQLPVPPVAQALIGDALPLETLQIVAPEDRMIGRIAGAHPTGCLSCVRVQVFTSGRPELLRRTWRTTPKVLTSSRLCEFRKAPTHLCPSDGFFIFTQTHRHTRTDLHSSAFFFTRRR